MPDLFHRPLATRANIVRTMPPEVCASFIGEIRRALPKTVAMNWQHRFLRDAEELLVEKYVLNLTPRQISHVLRCADIAGVSFEKFKAGNQTNV